MRVPSSLWLITLCGAVHGQPAPRAPNLRLVLPTEIPVVPGREVNLYFDNIILYPRSDLLLFEVDCPKGAQQHDRFTWTPKPEDVGEHPLAVKVEDLDGVLLAEGKTVIHVYPADAGAGRQITALIVGDSLTGAMTYTEEIVRLMEPPGNPKLTLIGNCAPFQDRPGVRNEGYGGWRASTFATLWGPDPITKEGRRGRSPFIFEENGKPGLDFRKYCLAQSDGKGPDFITILLGCNDNYGAKDGNLEASVDDFLKHMDILVAEFHRVCPDTKIGIVSLLPPAATQDASGAIVGCGQTRWQYRKNQHRVMERIIERYGNRQAENLFLVPAYVNLDCMHNYPVAEVPANARAEGPGAKIVRQINDVHPAASGYRQLADSIYGWMKGVLAK